MKRYGPVLNYSLPVCLAEAFGTAAKKADAARRAQDAEEPPFKWKQNALRHSYASFVCNDYVVTGPNVFVDCKAVNAYSERPHRHWTSGVLFDNVSFSERLSLCHRKNYGRKNKQPPYHLGHGWRRRTASRGTTRPRRCCSSRVRRAHTTG